MQLARCMRYFWLLLGVAVGAVVGLRAFFRGKRGREQARPEAPVDLVEEASLESFPASDAPSFTPRTRPGQHA